MFNMREANAPGNRVKSSKFADQNHPPRVNHVNNVKGNSNSSKLKSATSWGSHIVKGISGERKRPETKTTVTTTTTAAAPNRRVHPHAVYNGNSNKGGLAGSRDLLLEIENLRGLLKESKERESNLQAELSQGTRGNKILELEKEIQERSNEVDELSKKVQLLESEKSSLIESLASASKRHKDDCRRRADCDDDLKARNQHKPRCLEMEVVELRRLNKELQLQKRDIACRLASMEAQLSTLSKASEPDIIAKIKAEASLLRHTNEDLCKQVEGLQLSRLNEVEELTYLRWVNTRLRNELSNSGTPSASNGVSGCDLIESYTTPGMPIDKEEFLKSSSSKKLEVIKRLKKWPINDEDISSLKHQGDSPGNTQVENEEGKSPRRHSISGSKCWDEEPMLNKRRQSDCLMGFKETEKDAVPVDLPKFDSQQSQYFCNSQEPCKRLASVDIEKRALRMPNPPPKPSTSIASGPKDGGSSQARTPPPPPPPPPPAPRMSASSSMGAVQRAPQVVEFYHSLLKRDSRRDSSGGATSASVANVRSNMIGEIENRSSYLLAIKADVETQGEFVNSLIKEVHNAAYRDIEDVVAFVKWLDDELCFLVDERAVLKHFDWPEKKADTLREAAFGYKDLKKLEFEVTYYNDDPQLPCDIALRKLASLSEKMERAVYNLVRTRDSLMRSCKQFQVPTDWMLDSGIISKVKLGSVRLAKIYMKRVATELQSRELVEKDPGMDYMLLQGVRFAFRIHQFAGGFDAETMQAFEELRKLGRIVGNR